MIKAERLKPLNRAVNGRARGREVQCEFTVDEMTVHALGPGNGWRERRYEKRGLDPERCAHPAAVLLVERRLCARHAGQVALEIMLGEREEDGIQF